MPTKPSPEQPTKKKKGPGGRPTSYKAEYDRQAEVATAKGFTDKDLGKLFGVKEQTINNWKNDFPQFFESLKKGKEIADSKVVRSLYERANGYSHPDVHISNFQGQVTITPIIKHYAPDVTACIFWLKNRDPANWRDRQEHELDVGDKLGGIIDIIRKGLQKE